MDNSILCPPALATAALFLALVILDIFQQNTQLIPGHALFGVISTLLMAILCQKGAQMAAWGLFILPLVLLIIGWGIMVMRKDSRQRTAKVMPYSPCGCTRRPCQCPGMLGPGGTKQLFG